RRTHAFIERSIDRRAGLMVAADEIQSSRFPTPVLVVSQCEFQRAPSVSFPSRGQVYFHSGRQEDKLTRRNVYAGRENMTNISQNRFGS
ncbi:MAG: hypothetical protein MN733_15435, partial [Nitrososphaera sp.]|nr:hypothetical protein [Nitrososphaera sp.]